MAGHSHYSAYNVTIILILCLGSLTYGYCFSVISNTLGQPSFYDYLALTTDPEDPNSGYTNAVVGASNGLFSVGGLIGALTLGWLADKRGRKLALLASSAVTILGGAISAGSVHIGMFIVGRWVTGIGIGMLVCLVPLYQAEIAPPATRGFLGSSHGVVLVMGYSVAGWTGVGTYFSTNGSFAWRFPLALQCLFPLLILALLPAVPESPRWLIMEGQEAKAWTIVKRLYHTSQDLEDDQAKEEFYQMVAQVEADKPLIESESYIDLFRKPSYRKRMFCGGLTFFACESTGILVIYSYSVVLYTGLGFSGVLPLVLGASYVSSTVIANMISALLMDRIGRVKLLVCGVVGCAVALIFVAALTASFQGTSNTAGLKAGVFFYFLYVFIYGVCLDATGFVYAAEIFPNHIRSKGMGFSVAILFLTTIPLLCAGSTAFANIGWKFNLVFICVSAVTAPLIWFTFPETKGLSLEDINEVFDDTVAVRLNQITEDDKKKVASIAHDTVKRPASDMEQVEVMA